jgi:hypothetical protein
MTPDHAIILRDITHNLNSALASVGFGTVMATFVILLLVRAGAKPKGFSLAFLMIGAIVFCAGWAQWAQGLNLVWNVEIVKIIAIFAACATVGWIVLTIVERAPQTVLLGMLALLLVCVLFGALAMWASTKNLFLLAVVVVALSLVAACAFLGWALIRMAERRPIIIDPSQLSGAPRPEMLPREIDRGPLLERKPTAALQPYRRGG